MGCVRLRFTTPDDQGPEKVGLERGHHLQWEDQATTGMKFSIYVPVAGGIWSAQSVIGALSDILEARHPIFPESLTLCLQPTALLESAQVKEWSTNRGLRLHYCMDCPTFGP